mmetsp:Transcript_4811/g.13390  ORF Transcript_4811/g.13390 Transcript_4811/m.13390 type:complete len:208 (-) Transcript_4811:2003-2626(-)
MIVLGLLMVKVLDAVPIEPEHLVKLEMLGSANCIGLELGSPPPQDPVARFDGKALKHRRAVGGQFGVDPPDGPLVHRAIAMVVRERRWIKDAQYVGHKDLFIEDNPRPEQPLDGLSRQLKARNARVETMEVVRGKIHAGSDRSWSQPRERASVGSHRRRTIFSLGRSSPQSGSPCRPWGSQRRARWSPRSPRFPASAPSGQRRDRTP